MKEVHAALNPKVDEATQEGRDYARRMAGLTYLKVKADLPDEVWDAVARNAPVPLHERQKALQAKERFMRDKEMVRRYLDGDRDANTHLTTDQSDFGRARWRCRGSRKVSESRRCVFGRAQMTQTNKANLDTIDPPESGPKMLALPNDRWRNFVVALFDEDAPQHGRLLYAIRKAGFGTPTSSTKSLSVQANRIRHDERTKAAVAEYSIAAVRSGLAPDVVRGIRNVVNDPRHRDHAREFWPRLRPARPVANASYSQGR